MYYLISNKLEAADKKRALKHEYPYVIYMTSEQWQKEKKNYSEYLLSEKEPELYLTKADVNFHCLSGSFSIPNTEDLNKDDYAFMFLLDQDGLIFIDDSGYVRKATDYIANNKKWQNPCIERFLYDFLDYIIKDDLRIMERYEHELEKMEDDAEKENNMEENTSRINRIRSEIRRYYTHYGELLDLTQELEENENGFFDLENLRYFRYTISRLERLSNTASYIRDYAMQIDDMYREHIAMKQNNIMTLLTVITTVFAPLTLITGWYGMNFKYMPELNFLYSYPFVFMLCIVIVVLLLYYFKKKKWL